MAWWLLILGLLLVSCHHDEHGGPPSAHDDEPAIDCGTATLETCAYQAFNAARFFSGGICRPNGAAEFVIPPDTHDVAIRGSYTLVVGDEDCKPSESGCLCAEPGSPAWWFR